jgi:2,3-diketo-5-methylthio-1-phosphopentane phosphatase
MGSVNTSDLSAMRTNPKFIFFTDFDGTITATDSNDTMTDNIGMGRAKRQVLNDGVLHGTHSFRDAFKAMMDSVTTPYDQCIEFVTSRIKLDPGFKEFYDWARENNIPVVVLSSGMEPLIRALLVKYLGDEAEDLEIISNSVAVREGHKSLNVEGGWEMTFHDDSSFGHDKSIELRKYSSLPEGVRPTMFYAGDGVSDLSAAKETDLLFAKKGQDLIKYCIAEKIPFTEFEDWTSITATVKDIVAGKVDVKTVAKLGAEEASVKN